LGKGLLEKNSMEAIKSFRNNIYHIYISMGFRCELCDEWLPMLSFCKLCDKCYKIRTITKCYNAESILNHLQEHFLVTHAREEEEKALDEKFFKEEETRIQKEFEGDMAKLLEQKEKHLETINEEVVEKAKSDSEVEPVIEQEEALKVSDGVYDNAPRQTRYRAKKNKAYKNTNANTTKEI